MRRTHSRCLSKHFRYTLYINKSWERGAENFILIKVGGAEIHNAMFHDYRACQIFPLQYDYLRHAQQILKYALSKGQHDWNKRTVEELEGDADWNSSVCK
jgi:hypothetical protein